MTGVQTCALPICKHANIRRASERFELIDLGSLNGTYVNNNSIARATLNTGDEIQFGKFHMLFVQNKTK